MFLILSESSEHLQDTLLTKLLGQFIESHNTQFFQRPANLTLDCIGVFFPTRF